MLELAAGASAAGFGTPARQKNGIEPARTGSADEVDLRPIFLDQPVEHTPGERPKRSAAL